MDDQYPNERLEIDVNRRYRISHNQIIFNQIKTHV
jgi:hypothetical protein